MEKPDDLIENSKSKWGNKTLLTVFASLILGTNAFNAYIHNQDTNTNRIELEAENTQQAIDYERERSDKKDERIAEQGKFDIQVNNYKLEIKRLERIIEKYRINTPKLSTKRIFYLFDCCFSPTGFIE